MKLFKPSIPAAWRIYSMFALLNMASAGLVIFALQFHDQQVQALRQQRQQLQIVKMRHRQLHAQQAMMKHYLPKYLTLQKQGFSAEPQHNLWITQLRQLQQAQQLFPISYHMLSEQAFVAQFATQTPGPALYRTPMKFEMDLLHEGDLLALLAGLKVSTAGAFILRECKINRQQRLNPASADQSSVSLAPNLHANCILDWLTMPAINAQARPNTP